MITIQHRPGLITVSGHSGYAPPGQDIVCSAISTLTQTLVSSLVDVGSDEISCDIRHGSAVIRYGEDQSEQMTLLIRSFFIGVSGVASAYPEHVKII